MAPDMAVEKNKLVMSVPHDGHARVVTFVLSVLLHLCVVAVFLLNPMWNKSASTAPDVGDAFLVSIVTPETIAATVENPNPEKKLADQGLIKKEESKKSQNIMTRAKVANTGLTRDDDFVAGSAKAKAEYYDRAHGLRGIKHIRVRRAGVGKRASWLYPLCWIVPGRLHPSVLCVHQDIICWMMRRCARWMRPTLFPHFPIICANRVSD